MCYLFRRVLFFEGICHYGCDYSCYNRLKLLVGHSLGACEETTYPITGDGGGEVQCAIKYTMVEALNPLLPHPYYPYFEPMAKQ